MLNAGRADFIKQFRPSYKPTAPFSKTTLALLAFVSVSIIGIGYLIFVQQQELKSFMQVLNTEIVDMNRKFAKCPVISNTTKKKKCSANAASPECDDTFDKQHADVICKDIDFCEQKITVEEEPVIVSIDDETAVASDDAEPDMQQLLLIENEEHEDDNQQREEEEEEKETNQKKKRKYNRKSKKKNNLNPNI